MDILLELVFRGLIIRIFGINTRYLFFTIVGRKKSIKLLSGKHKKDGGVSQDFLNAVVGLVSFSLFTIFIAFIYDRLIL